MALNTYPYSPFPASTEQLHKGDNEELQAQIDAIKDGTDIDSFGDVETALGVVTEDITNLENDKADLEVVAAEFDAEAGTYAVGDLVTYDGKLYEFTSEHSTAGAWDPTEVTEKTVADEIGAIKSGLTNVVSTLANIDNLKVQVFSIEAGASKVISVSGIALIYSDRGALIMKGPSNRGVMLVSNWAVTVEDIDASSFILTSATGGGTQFVSLCKNGIVVSDPS